MTYIKVSVYQVAMIDSQTQGKKSDCLTFDSMFQTQLDKMWDYWLHRQEDLVTVLVVAAKKPFKIVDPSRGNKKWVMASSLSKGEERGVILLQLFIFQGRIFIHTLFELFCFYFCKDWLCLGPRGRWYWSWWWRILSNCSKQYSFHAGL